MSAKDSFNEPAGGFKPATHALYISDDNFPKDCYPIGTLEEIEAIYTQLLNNRVPEDLDPIAYGMTIKNLRNHMRIYELRQQPNLRAVKQDPLTAAIKVLDPGSLATKSLDRLSEMEPEEVIKKGVGGLFKVAETAYGAWRGNPFSMIKGGKYVNDARKRATDFFHQAQDMRKDIMSRVNGLDENVDGIAVNGVRFVKGAWLMEPVNATPLPDLSVLGTASQQQDNNSAEEAPAKKTTRRKPPGGPRKG